MSEGQRFPSIRDVRAVLVELNRTPISGDEGLDVRLQVHGDHWKIWSGLSDYDTDHRGYWGASSIPGSRRRFNATDTARDLINQARDHHADSGE